MRLRAIRQEILNNAANRSQPGGAAGRLGKAERDQVRKYSHMMAIVAQYLTAKDILGETNRP